MAETDEGQERTEDPTGRKLERALEEGQILTSKELLMAAVMLGGALQISIGGHYYFTEFLNAFRNGLDFSDVLQRDLSLPSAIVARVTDIALPMIFFSIPLVAILVTAQIAFGGFHFVTANIGFKFDKLSPFKGLGRIFGISGLIELVKSIGKTIVIGIAGVVYILYRLPEVMALGRMPFEIALADAGSLVASTLLVLVFATLIIAAGDALYQWYRHRQSLMMTKQEVKDEMKETDGSPEIKNRIRKLQREAAERGSVANINQAQVIITNPQHFAVGLRYDFVKGTAPKVVVKGSDAIAKMIREKAAEKKMPVLEYPMLARAIYFTSEIGGEIHSELYRAVATVLSFVFHAGAEGEKPEIEVPKELQFDMNGRLMERRRVA